MTNYKEISKKSKQQIYRSLVDLLKLKNLKINKFETKFLFNKIFSISQIAELEEWFGLNKFADAELILDQIKTDLMFYIKKCICLLFPNKQTT